MQRAFDDIANDEPFREPRLQVSANIAGREEIAIDVVNCDTYAIDLYADHVFLVDIVDAAHVMPLLGHELAPWW